MSIVTKSRGFFLCWFAPDLSNCSGSICWLPGWHICCTGRALHQDFKRMKFASEWSVGRSRLLALWRPAATHKPPFITSCGEEKFEVVAEEEMFYMNKMLMLSSCVPAQFKCQTKHPGHNYSEQYVQMNFSDEKRTWFDFVLCSSLCAQVSLLDPSPCFSAGSYCIACVS